MPPTIKLEQATGFGLLMLKAILNGGGDETSDYHIFSFIPARSSHQFTG